MSKLAFLVSTGLAIGLAMASTSASAEEAIAGLKLGTPRTEVLKASAARYPSRAFLGLGAMK